MVLMRARSARMRLDAAFAGVLVATIPDKLTDQELR
jgi:hypothetical protein